MDNDISYNLPQTLESKLWDIISPYNGCLMCKSDADDIYPTDYIYDVMLRKVKLLQDLRGDIESGIRREA